MRRRTTPTPENAISAARRLALKSGMYIVTRPDCFLLYRKNPNPDGRGIFLGRRTTPHQTLALVRSCSTTTGATK